MQSTPMIAPFARRGTARTERIRKRWTLPAAFLSGAAAAGGIAAVNSLGNLAGFFGPYAMGWIKDSTGSFAAGLLCLAGAGLVGVAVVLLLRHDTALENAPDPLVEEGSGRRA